MRNAGASYISNIFAAPVTVLQNWAMARLRPDGPLSLLAGRGFLTMAGRPRLALRTD